MAVKVTEKTVESKQFWDEEVIIGMTPAATGKSATRTALCRKDDQWFVDLRKFVDKKGDEAGTYRQHTIHGISIPVDKPENLAVIISDIQKAGARAFKKARKVG